MRQFSFPAALQILCVSVALSGQTAFAAVQFDVGANGPTGNRWTLGSGWGTQSGQLDVVFNVSASLPNDAFALKTGQSYSFDFGTVQLRETDISSNETDNLQVTAYLTLDLPTAGQVAIPGSATAWQGNVSDSANDLKITFNPVYIDDGQYGKFKVQLTDLTFNKCETLCLDACVSLCCEPCNSVVPEPATIVIWLVLGAGCWLGARHRRLRRQL